MKIVNFSKVAIGLILVAQFAFTNMLDDVKGVQKGLRRRRYGEMQCSSGHVSAWYNV